MCRAREPHREPRSVFLCDVGLSISISKDGCYPFCYLSSHFETCPDDKAIRGRAFRPIGASFVSLRRS